jgi:hypothetical protein
MKVTVKDTGKATVKVMGNTMIHLCDSAMQQCIPLHG